MLSNEQISTVLRTNGFKVTPQRLVVYNALAATDNHPRAEDLYAVLQPKYPSMSLATVYKTLDTLHKLRLVRMIDLGEGSARYDAKTEQHHHVQCHKCGKIFDVYNLPVKGLIDEAVKQSGVIINRQDLYFYGLCNHCATPSNLLK